MKYNKRNKILLVILLLVVITTIGYAFLTTSLNIVGTSKIKNARWDVHFENIVVKDGSVTPTKAATIENDTTVSFNVNFKQPGEFYEFTVDVVNNGSMDAMIGTITKEPVLTPVQEKYLTYEVKYNGVTDLHEKDSLPVGDRKTLKIFLKIRTDLNKEDLPQEINDLSINYQIDYVQADETAVSVVLGEKATTKIENLFTTAAVDNGLEKDDTIDENLRYVGASPKNYVLFNDEKWRIIGVFKTQTEENGPFTKRVKLVRDELLLNASWDSSASDVNRGGGINQWGPSIYSSGPNEGNQYEGSDIYRLLNGYYLGTGGCEYCKGLSQSDCSAINTTCDFAPLKETAKRMIAEVVWNTGGLKDTGSISSSSSYQQERGEVNGKICEGTTYKDGKNCSDEVGRTTEWTGKVGLIYPSDYGYASTNDACRAKIGDYQNNPCKIDNWLHKGSDYWTLSPYVSPGNAYIGWLVRSDGHISDTAESSSHGVCPSIYLNSNVLITSGDGTVDSPYHLSA